MKTILLIILTFTLLNGMAQNRDTVRIHDNWYKRDTSSLKRSLKDSLNRDHEMKIISPAENDTPKALRIISGDKETTKKLEAEENNVYEIEVFGSRYRKSRDYRNRGYHRFRGHLCGANFGFVNFTQTDYSMYPAGEDGFMDLDYANSFVMQFNICEQSINFVPRNNFGLVMGLGLEYQRLRFDKKQVSIALDEDNRVVPRVLDPDWRVKKNSLKILYLSIPVMFELQFPARQYRRFYMAAGAMGGIRLLSRTKIIYRNTEGKKKHSRSTDDYSLMPVKADLIARVGYSNWNVWATYTVTDMFKNKKGPELHPYALGLGVTF